MYLPPPVTGSRSVMDPGPYRPQRPGGMQSLPADIRGGLAGAHRGAQGAGEAAVPGLARQCDVPGQKVTLRPAVGRGEVAHRRAEPILYLGLGVTDLAGGRRVVESDRKSTRLNSS